MWPKPTGEALGCDPSLSWVRIPPATPHFPSCARTGFSAIAFDSKGVNHVANCPLARKPPCRDPDTACTASVKSLMNSEKS